MASKRAFRTKLTERPKDVIEEAEPPSTSVVDLDPSAPNNKFVNDGSFLEMFRRIQQGKNSAAEQNTEVTGQNSTTSTDKMPQGSSATNSNIQIPVRISGLILLSYSIF